MRLCEPCTVIDGYATRTLLRPLVHRGGLRADILTGGEIERGDRLVSSGDDVAHLPREAPDRA
jgi:MOSC domain-containing protein YiiM